MTTKSILNAVFLKKYSSLSSRFLIELAGYDTLKNIPLETVTLPTRENVDYQKYEIQYTLINGYTPFHDLDLCQDVLSFLAEMYFYRRLIINNMPILNIKKGEDIWQDIKIVCEQYADKVKSPLKLSNGLHDEFTKHYKLGVFTDAKPHHFIRSKNQVCRVDFDGFATAHILSDTAQFTTYMQIEGKMSHGDMWKFCSGFLSKINIPITKRSKQIFWFLCLYSNLRKRPYVYERDLIMGKALDHTLEPLIDLILTEEKLVGDSSKW